MKRYAGFTTFTVTLLLILILVGISLLVGKLMGVMVISGVRRDKRSGVSC